MLNMKKSVCVLVVLLLIPLVYAECVIPKDGMIISEDVVFCKGVYTVSNINFEDNFKVDCNDSFINGDILGNAFYIFNNKNLEIKNCVIQNFESGMYIQDSKDIKIVNTIISKNKFGISNVSSQNIFLKNNTILDNVQNVITLNPVKPE